MQHTTNHPQNRQKRYKSLKYAIIVLALGVSVFSFTQCVKSDHLVTEKETAKQRLEIMGSHIIPTAEANAMVKRYDELIGPIIEQQYKKANPGYISPTQVVYDIDPLIAFLEELKANGSNKVVVRYAAVDGDNQNSRIPGLPYHGLLFYGNKQPQTENTNGNQTDPNGKVFDGGSLIPPPYPDTTASTGN